MPTFKPDATDLRGLRSNASVLFYSGAVGVGKSSSILMKIIQFAATKMLPVNGVRRCRVAVVRQDLPKLETTTLLVLNEWFKDAFKLHGNYPKYGMLSIANQDGTRSDIEFVLRGMPDNEKDIYDNMSGFPANVLWINEVQTYSSPYIVEIGYQRMGRYLSKAEGNQGFGLVVCDFNPPSAGHWLAKWEKAPPDKVEATLKIEGYDASQDKNPFTVEFVRWPSPVIPVLDKDGETIGYKVNSAADYFYKQPAGFGYWAKILQANSLNPQAIRTNILGEYGYSSSGIPIYLNVYKERVHVAENPIAFDPNDKVYVGCDPSGFRGAAVIMQITTRGVSFHASIAEPTETLSFFELLNDHIIPWLRFRQVPNANVLFVLDPANARSSGDGKLTPKEECMAAGFDAVNAPTNDPVARIEALRYFLLKIGGVIIDPSQETEYLRQGLASEYYWKRQGANNTGAAQKPEKTRPFSDCVESAQYACLYLRRGANREDAKSFNQVAGQEQAGYLTSDDGVMS